MVRRTHTGYDPEERYLVIVRLASHVTIEHMQSAAFIVHDLPHTLEMSTAVAVALLLLLLLLLLQLAFAAQLIG
jgi:hypothetical protein